MNGSLALRSPAWRWGVCGLLLAATTINYMDRITLSSASPRVTAEFRLTHEQYGQLEEGFSWAFAAGSLLFGVLADRINLRFLYPAVLLLWSAMGLSSGLVASYRGLLICRTLLGLFEAGHWPCALRTIQKILEPKDRALGNGLLQSGASIGAAATPYIVQAFLDRELGWRLPFQVIGAIGSVWAVFWFLTLRTGDLAPEPPSADRQDGFLKSVLSRRFLALVIMISLINTTWQVLRAWLVLFLHEGRGFEEGFANRFQSFYYLATDAGVLTSGFIALQLSRRGFSVHSSRVFAFVLMALLALLSIPVALLPRGALLLGALLVVGFGALGVFSSYYSFAQEVPERHVGKITGLLGVCGWIATGRAQLLFGKTVDRLHSYDLGVALAGCAPLLAILLFFLIWKRDPAEGELS